MKVNKLEIPEITRLIQQKKPLEAIAADGSFAVKVKKYVPFCCIALHSGSGLSSDLQPKIALDELERWHWEAPQTGKFILSLPITLIARQSLFEYDLDANPEACIQETIDGQAIWKKDFPELKLSRPKLVTKIFTSY